jgi:hypothetical protein
MTENEANELLDRLFLKHTGKTYATDSPPASPSATAADSPGLDGDDPNSLASIRRDFPDLFPRIPDPKK